MAAQVMIELVPDTSKVKSALETLEATGGVDEKAGAAFKEGNADLQKRNTLLKENSTLIGQVGKATKDVATSVIKISGADFARQMQEQNKSAGQLISSLAGVTQAENKLVTASTSLRTEKRRLQQQIAELIHAGQQESAMFRELVQRAGEIDDAMADASDAIRRTGSDTQGLDNALLAARGVAAGFTVVTGVTALFGQESEEVQKVLLKVNAAMAILNGLQEIQNILKSEYVRTLLASITATEAQTVAVTAEATATEGAMVAQTGLNAAIKANPVGLILSVLAVAVTAYLAYSAQVEDAEEAQQKFNDALDPKRLADYNKELDRSLQLTTALLQARGAKSSEIIRAEINVLEKQKEAAAAEIKRVSAVMFLQETSEANREAAIKRIADLRSQKDEIDFQIKLKNFEGEKAFNDERLKQTEEQKKAAEEAARLGKSASEQQKRLDEQELERQRKINEELDKQVDKLGEWQRIRAQNARDLQQKETDEFKQQLAERGDAAIKAQDAQTVLDDKWRENRKRLAEEEKALRREVARATIQFAAEAANAIFEISRARQQAELDAQLEALDKQKENALKTQNLTETQRMELDKKFDRERRRLNNEAARKQRQAQSAQALVNTLLAVTSALATVVPTVPAGILAAAAAFASGMVQVAKINSTPLPQYAKGGENIPAGWSLVGEQGPELVKMKGGENVYTASDTKRMLSDWSMSDHSGDISWSRSNTSGGIDYDKLADAIARKMPHAPNVSLNADEHGFTIFMQQQNSRRIIRNQRYSTRG